MILTPQVTEGEADSITQEQLDQTVNIIRQRIDGFGVAEAEVTTQGSGANSAVVVSVPGELSQEQQDAIASTAKLDFRPVLAAAGGIPTTAPSASPTPEPTATGSASPKPKKSAKASPKASGNGAAVTGGLLPAADPTASPGADHPAGEPDRIGQPLGRPDGQRAAAADPEQDQRRGAAGEVRRARLHREGRAHRRQAGRPDAVHGHLPDRRDGEVPAGAGHGARHPADQRPGQPAAAGHRRLDRQPVAEQRGRDRVPEVPRPTCPSSSRR